MNLLAGAFRSISRRLVRTLLIGTVLGLSVAVLVSTIAGVQASQKNVQLVVDVGRDLPRFIEADRALLQQALNNLVENAIKYTPENGMVILRVNTHLEDLQFEVQDNGIGIVPGDLPRLFEKFYRGSQREALTQRGSGLGLAIVRSIAERHGGKVWVESVLGQGSTFFLLIPFTRPDEVV